MLTILYSAPNWLVSWILPYQSFHNIKRGRKVSELESVRIGKCQNRKVSESENVRI